MKITHSQIVMMLLYSSLFHVGIGAYLFSSQEKKEPEALKMIEISLAKIEKLDNKIKAQQSTKKKKYILDDVGEVKKKKSIKKVVKKQAKPKTTSKTAAIKKVVVPKITAQEEQVVKSGVKNVNAPALDAQISASYEQAIVSWLERYKRYPKRAKRKGITGEALLRLRIDQNGKVLTSNLEKSSTQNMLDQEVLQMVQRANPFPKVPEGLSKRQREFLIPVAFQVGN